jgi:cysteine desulfurase
MIYADNAATSKLDLDAFESMKPFLLEEYGNASQPYFFSRKNKKALKEARELIASCINASPGEIYFTSCGTESDNWAIKGTTLLAKKRKGIITSEIEHHAILNSCHMMEKFNNPVKYLPVDKYGKIDVKTLEEVITDNDKIVSIMMANNEIGTIQDIRSLSEIAHMNGAIFHTDAVQALGHIEVDVEMLGIDLLSGSAHKFNGPKGIGFLYIRNETEIVRFIDGGSQERGYRAGTENVASIVGMAVALLKNCESIDSNTTYLKNLEKILLDTLSESEIDYIHNGGEKRIPGNINLSIKNGNGEQLLHRLDLMGICISTGSACDGENAKISHVIKAIGVPNEYAKGTIRISLGHDNTVEEAKEIAEAIIRVMK